MAESSSNLGDSDRDRLAGGGGDSDRVSFQGYHESRETGKKRKRMPKWTKQVTINSRTELEGPFVDGYSWRKYGQKDILGAKFPRAYYRCTHRNLQGCPATKKVQRSDESPNIVDVTYCGHHTCVHLPQPAPPGGPNQQKKTSPARMSKVGLQVLEEGFLSRALASAEPSTTSEGSQIISDLTNEKYQSRGDYDTWDTASWTSEDSTEEISEYATERRAGGGHSVPTADSALSLSGSLRNDAKSVFQVYHGSRETGKKRFVSDDCSWKNYGNKEILGTNFTRNYFRCFPKNRFFKLAQNIHPVPSVPGDTYERPLKRVTTESEPTSKTRPLTLCRVTPRRPEVFSLPSPLRKEVNINPVMMEGSQIIPWLREVQSQALANVEECAVSFGRSVAASSSSAAGTGKGYASSPLTVDFFAPSWEDPAFPVPPGLPKLHPHVAEEEMYQGLTSWASKHMSTRWWLEISYLHSVSNASVDAQVPLEYKTFLPDTNGNNPGVHLDIFWSSPGLLNNNNERLLLRCLHNHFTSLHSLSVSGYPDILPLLGDVLPYLTSLYKLDISGCKGLASLLNMLGKDLNSIKVLYVRDCSDLTSLSGGMLHHLTALEVLSITNCEELTSLVFEELIFLTDMWIERCPKLTGASTEAWLSPLQSLSIDNTSLLANGFIQNITNLQELCVHNCPQLSSFTVEEENGLQSLVSLQILEIAYCYNLRYLPSGLHKLPSLKRLRITYCSKIQFLPEKGPDSLEDLYISGCPLLKEWWSQHGAKSGWPKIQIE